MEWDTQGAQRELELRHIQGCDRMLAPGPAGKLLESGLDSLACNSEKVGSSLCVCRIVNHLYFIL